MNLEIKEVKTGRELKQFIYLPSKIHKDHDNWVPPVYSDEWTFFNPKKNRAFDHSTTILYLALKEGRIAGRIMGIINHKYNKAHNEKDGRFCFLETWDDFEVARFLLEAVEEWAFSHGMKHLVGPLAFSDKDPQGLLIEGFHQPVVIASNCNFPYLVDFLGKAGFSKKVDLVVYTLKVPETIPDIYRKISERTLRNHPELKLVSLTSRLQLKKYVRPVLQLVNETFKDIYGFSAMEEVEMDEFAKRYLMILDPRFLKVVENREGEVVSFVLAMPDISKGIIKSRGKVFPFGFIYILRSQKKTRQLNLLLGAIRQDYRNSGLDAIMGMHIFESAQKAGFTHIDSHLELETNVKVRAEMEKMQGKVYKRFRIFKKDIVTLPEEVEKETAKATGS
ncbi:MAG TPA: hypothetical protein VE870_12865 [Bacteroidales bacterium]|nr:hypothetical protein [Bacteroidales bacterium]